jgi:hypothetical protein
MMVWILFRVLKEILEALGPPELLAQRVIPEVKVLDLLMSKF